MCGIAGLIGTFRQEEGRKIVSKMNSTLIHRGPDDEGVWSSDGFAFAMRRLSIIDLAGGHQPIWSENGVGIVFNGEIYNYQKLRKELIAKGQVFKTRSDTEVILRLYQAGGIESVKQLEGMFAICIYDPNNSRVFLIRDRMGIKPLYYGRMKGSFYFASEIKAILAGMPARPGLNYRSIGHYLTLRYVPAPKTIWENINKLEPAHYLAYDLKTNEGRDTCYWQVDFCSQELTEDRNYPAEFEKLFLESVEKHLITSDVPVGVLLSGGLDSSLISAAAMELGHRNFHTFNVSFDHSISAEEKKYAAFLSRQISSHHHEIVIKQQDFIDFLPAFVKYTDEPIADLAAVPLYYVSRLAREDVKVVLTGEGADEVFAGYDLERLAKKLDILRSLSGMMPTGLLKIVARDFPSARLKNLSKYGWSQYLKGLPAHISYDWPGQEKEHLWMHKQPLPDTEALIRSWYDAAASLHPLDQLQQVYCRSWLVEDLLMKADKMSMANSLELRVPFLDHPLVEWGAKLPLAWKVGDKQNGYVSKKILREFAAARIPQGIINRSKQGFPVPAYLWLKEDLGCWAENYLLKENRFLGTFLDVSILKPFLAQARRGNNTAAHKIWNLIILEEWGRSWL